MLCHSFFVYKNGRLAESVHTLIFYDFKKSKTSRNAKNLKENDFYSTPYNTQTYGSFSYMELSVPCLSLNISIIEQSLILKRIDQGFDRYTYFCTRVN